MVLNRIPKRTILRNKSQFLGIIILVAIASMTYALFAVSMRNIRETTIITLSITTRKMGIL